MPAFLKKIYRDNPVRWTILAVVYPFACYATYLDNRDKVPLWAILTSCVLGVVLGATMVHFIMKGFDIADRWLDKLFGMKSK